MKLYYFPGACPLASHIIMEWTGQPYELVEVSREEIKQPDYLALNPVGAVPTLVDGNFVLTQSPAILEYIAEKHPDAGLLGDDAQARARTRQWLSFCNSDLHRTFALIFQMPYFSAQDSHTAEVLTAQTEERLKFLFTVANKQLNGQAWLTGSRSVADPYLYVIMRWAHATGLNLSGMDNLQAFYAQMEEDPGVRAALKAQGLA